MNSGRLLNSELSSVIARMGYTDCLVGADAGLPTGEGTPYSKVILHSGVVF